MLRSCRSIPAMMMLLAASMSMSPVVSATATAVDNTTHEAINWWVVSAAAADNTITNITDGMINWVRSQGGSFNPKVEIRRMDPSNNSSPLGVFAKESLDEKELIMHIPDKCYIQVWDAAIDMGALDFEEAKDANLFNLCELTHELIKEMELGDQSQFAPYIAYLKTQKSGQLPAHWSEQGKHVLRNISFPGSEIVDWIDLNFHTTGCISSDDPFEAYMVELVVQRSFDAALIPLWDMVNHDNGRINTENDSMYSEGGIKVRASRLIEAGEEIFASYDLCIDCQQIDDVWGTPEILKDFGFVENYPHRWIFDNIGSTIWFEIVSTPHDGLSVIFDTLEEDSFGIPKRKDILFLQSELERLQRVGKEFLKEKGSIPQYEWDMVNAYYAAAVTGISMGIEAIAKTASI